jgi:hypothetical protein
MSLGGLLGWLMLVTPAQAAEHPAFLPVRDVTATYVLTVPGRPDATYRLDYDATDERARIVDPARGLLLLVDLPAGRAELVVPAMRAVVEAPDLSGLARQVYDAAGARFTPLGPGHYAGLGCEKYLVLTGQGSGTACLTKDGVVLHFAGRDAHGAANVTAVSVVMAHVARGEFEAPDGYTQIQLPPGALAQLLGQ